MSAIPAHMVWPRFCGLLPVDVRIMQLPQLPLRVGNEEVMPATVVRDLGIYIDADVSMRSHVTKTVFGEKQLI